MTMDCLKEYLMRAASAVILVGLWAVGALGQASSYVECPGPIYSRKEVSTPVKMIGNPDFAKDVSGRVRLEAVICPSGTVTDVLVIDSRPPEIGQSVAAALSQVGFKAAELNGEKVP